MYKPLLICMLVFISMGCNSYHWANDTWKGKDKAQHFAFSAAISAAGNAYADKQNRQHHDAAMFGILLSVSLGVAKELYDSRATGTGWSWHDFTYDIAGSIAGYSVYQSLK